MWRAVSCPKTTRQLAQSSTGLILSPDIIDGLAVFGFLFERSGRSGRLPDPLLEFTLNNRPNSTYTDASGKMAWNATVVPTPVDLQALLSPYYGG